MTIRLKAANTTEKPKGFQHVKGAADRVVARSALAMAKASSAGLTKNQDIEVANFMRSEPHLRATVRKTGDKYKVIKRDGYTTAGGIEDRQAITEAKKLSV